MFCQFVQTQIICCIKERTKLLRRNRHVNKVFRVLTQQVAPLAGSLNGWSASFQRSITDPGLLTRTSWRNTNVSRYQDCANKRQIKYLRESVFCAVTDSWRVGYETKQRSRQAGRQVGRQAGRQAGWLTDWQTERRADIAFGYTLLRILSNSCPF